MSASSNEELLKKCLIEALGINASEYSKKFKLGDSAKWDSVGHLSLMFAIESEFDLKFDIERMPELTSVEILLLEIEKLKK